MTASIPIDSSRYARCIQVSKRVRWEIDRDVIRGREFDTHNHYLPTGLSKVDEMNTLTADEKRFMSQVQGRSYANIFGLVERFIGAKILEVSRDHWFGDQIALEALVRMSDEELKHQELFRRVEALAARTMPTGYRFEQDANRVAQAVLTKCTWAVLALTCHIELFTQSHYRQSIHDNPELSELYRDIFLYHWKEESQHAIIDELEWQREDRKLTETGRDTAVGDFIDLVVAVDDILQAQAAADTDYFAANIGRGMHADEVENIGRNVLRAYRWQYILSGAQEPRFVQLLTGMLNENQLGRIQAALATLQ